MAFIDSLRAALSARGITFSSFYNASSSAETTVLMMYGAVFLVRGTAIRLPNRFYFNNQAEVAAFQSSVSSSLQTIGGTAIELQAEAMTALQAAVSQAAAANLQITPRGGATAARRSYTDTVTFWNNKIESGIRHWTATANARGQRLTAAEAATLRSLSGFAQVENVLALEARGFWFSTNHRKTILASVAAPGTSQHLFMLALDITQYGDARVRTIMENNGWFQTVFQDHPHFTYLGIPASQLTSLGLVSQTDAGQTFWTPA